MTECENCGTDFNWPGVEGYESERHNWVRLVVSDRDGDFACPTCNTAIEDPR